MARPLKSDGLVWNEKKGWLTRAVVSIDGSKVRKVLELGTRDRLVARRKRARLLAEQPTGSDVKATAAAALTVREAAAATIERWRADGVTTLGDRKSALRRFVLGCAADCAEQHHHRHGCAKECSEAHHSREPHHIGDRPAAAVTKSEIEAIYAAMVAAGRARQTLVHIRNVMAAVFDDLWRDEQIPENPVKRARLPKVQRDNRQRAVMTDAELIAYLEWQHPDPDFGLGVIERQTMAALSWCFGGLRTGELHAMCWEDFAPGFVSGKVRRRKTAEVQELPLPDVLQPYLERWARQWGNPKVGPIFPVLCGDDAGKKGKEKSSHAKALRRDLMRAFGLEVWKPEPPKPGDKRLRGIWQRKPLAAWTPRQRELFTDTDVSRRLDFHSFRRAAAGALARAGVNEQIAMAYLNHADSKTHRRYWAAAQILSAVPGALPALPLPLEPAAKGRLAYSRQTQRDHRKRSPMILGRRDRVRTCDHRLVRPALYR